MKKRALILFAMAAVLLIGSVCGGCAAAEAGKEPAARTILLWANGARMDTREYGAVANRLIKMMEAEIPDTVNVIVLTGGVSDGWRPDLPLEGADSIRTDCNQIWKMKGAHDGQRGALVLLEENGLPGAEKGSLSHPDTLKAFIDYGAANWPAEKYDLILINHGAGPALGWSMDEVFPRKDAPVMSLPEICGALKGGSVERFDFICFYACLMGSVEDAVMLSPYADTLIFSEENLPGTGVEFNGMMELLREDPRTDSFLLGRRIVDDTIGSFTTGDLAENMVATCSAVNTKNLVKRLVPELAALSEILYREAAEPGKNGEYGFYDELRSIRKSVEFGRSSKPGYQLFDLGNFVTALGIADAEYDSASDVRELKNAYTDVSVRIMAILNDRDGSGDDVLYSRDTASSHKAVGTIYTRDAEGKLIRDDSGFVKSTGLSIFFDMEQSFHSPNYGRAIEQCLALGDLDGDSARFLKTYRDAALLYALIQGSGRAVYELGGRTDLTTADLVAAWEKLGIASWDNSARGMPDSGLKDTLGFVRETGFDVDTWLQKVAAQQASEIMRKENITVRRRESDRDRDTAGSYRVTSETLSARQLDNLYMRVKLKADYPYNRVDYLDFSGEYVPFGERYLAGSLSSDLLMPALFYGENGGDFLRLVYGSHAAMEIGLYDGYWYVLKDSAGNSGLVQVYTDPNDPKHIQVPGFVHFDKERGESNWGMIDFFLDEGEEVPAAGFAINHDRQELTEGSLPLNQEMLSGSQIQAIGKLKPRMMWVRIGPEMTLDGSETGGLKLVRVPAAEIKEVKGVLGEYYLRDIYGNELILTDAVAAAENEPLLKNLAFAEAKAENGTVTVTYGGQTLDPDLDYMVYTKDGETLIQGVGEYAGSIVPEDGKEGE